MGVVGGVSRRTYGNIIKFFDAGPLIGVASRCSSTGPSAAGRTLVHSVGRGGCKRTQQERKQRKVVGLCKLPSQNL